MIETFEQMALRVAESMPEFVWKEGSFSECGVLPREAVSFAKAIREELRKNQKPAAYQIQGTKLNGQLLHVYEYELDTCKEIAPYKACATPLYPDYVQNYDQLQRIAELEKQRDELVKALEKFRDNVLFRIGCNSPYREVAREYFEYIKPILASVKTSVGSSDEQGGV